MIFSHILFKKEKTKEIFSFLEFLLFSIILLPISIILLIFFGIIMGLFIGASLICSFCESAFKKESPFTLTLKEQYHKFKEKEMRTEILLGIFFVIGCGLFGLSLGMIENAKNKNQDMLFEEAPVKTFILKDSSSIISSFYQNNNGVNFYSSSAISSPYNSEILEAVKTTLTQFVDVDNIKTLTANYRHITDGELLLGEYVLPKMDKFCCSLLTLTINGKEDKKFAIDVEISKVDNIRTFIYHIYLYKDDLAHVFLVKEIDTKIKDKEKEKFEIAESFSFISSDFSLPTQRFYNKDKVIDFSEEKLKEQNSTLNEIVLLIKQIKNNEMLHLFFN